MQIHGFERFEYLKDIARRDRALLTAQTSGKGSAKSNNSARRDMVTVSGTSASPHNITSSAEPSQLDRVWESYIRQVENRNRRRQAARRAEREVENAEAGWGKRSRFPPLHGRTGDFTLKQFLSHMEHKWVHRV